MAGVRNDLVLVQGLLSQAEQSCRSDQRALAVGDEDDVARLALFLASPAAAYMAGSVVVVDGGMLIA